MSRNRKVKSKFAQLYRESLKIIPRCKPEIIKPIVAIATEDIRRLVLKFFEGNEEKTEFWFKTPNPLLGGIVPEKMIAMGREVRLLRFVQEQLAENESPLTE